MKKVFTLIAAFMGFASQSQITLEHTYSTNNLQVMFVSDSDYVFYNVDSVNVYIHSASHVLLKTIAHGESIQPLVQNVSQKLFDMDAGYEFILLSIGSNSYKVMNDDGTTIMSGQGFAYAAKVPGGAKMIARTSIDSKVYDLPGVMYTSRVKELGGVSTFDPYPNPSADWIRLPYEMTGATGTLNIIDMAGRVQKSYVVSGMFSDILVQSGTLPAGQYLYYIEVDGIRSNSKTFVINQ